ncbi:hypothetical protein JTE90_025489 [Oedothorax gibbosus]|uniref:Uncharacterized protein n=1 Tax=Oedothorax gibbosus TaxID=931172 RepID=A0AAV6UXD8_9ARAC|nr:hypothetical protein JTE90_025489 [Oedothorax gibbosus]
MQLTIYFATFLVFLIPGGNAADANAGNGYCTLPAPVESFAASFYTALLVSTDPKIANSLEIKGIEGALKLYLILKKDLEGLYVCNGENVAFTSASGIATVETLKLLDYFNKKSMTYGSVLYRQGILDCSNSVSLSLRLYEHYKKTLKGLDSNNFETYFIGMVRAIHQLYIDLGLNLHDVTQQTAHQFRDEFKDSDKCIQETATN